jgi:hypothetical protein
MGLIMIASFVISLIAAIFLALRFTVFVLVPATLLAAAAIIAVGNQPRVTMALTLLGTVVLLQIGYLVGWTIRAHLQRRTKGAIRSKSIVRFRSWMAVGTSKKQFGSSFHAGKVLSRGRLVPK